MTNTKPSQDKKLRKELLKKAEETLLETKKQLLREIRERVKEETEGSMDEGRDTYDLASDERDREINFILNDREREKLHAIDDALQRIKDKTYGICECGCENCEGEIQLGRLKILPFTRLCVKCQEEVEKERKIQKKFEDERTYRKLAITDIEEEN
ncbi:MAG: TraR/DksA C4-type zinc finger protein, partial [Deltaproteobacteria bacterium]|nr:TraR/DksA C4-type zinc finger protein [Deltaproteobacteria bacterium]